MPQSLIAFMDAEGTLHSVPLAVRIGAKRGTIAKLARAEAIALVESGEWDAELPLRLHSMSGVWTYGGSFVREVTMQDVSEVSTGFGLGWDATEIVRPNATDRFDITADDTAKHPRYVVVKHGSHYVSGANSATHTYTVKDTTTSEQIIDPLTKEDAEAYAADWNESPNRRPGASAWQSA